LAQAVVCKGDRLAIASPPLPRTIMAGMYIQHSWGTKLGDEVAMIMEKLPLEDVAHARTTCRAWSSNLFAQRSVLQGRLAALLVARIKRARHVVPSGSLAPGDNAAPLPTTIVVDETMDPCVFDLLFGMQAGITRPEQPVELTFKKPAEVLAALPGLPPVVRDVDSNAPQLPSCPLRCWAGYADGQVRYDPAVSKFTLMVRSRVLKLSGYWEKTLDGMVLRDYLEA